MSNFQEPLDQVYAVCESYESGVGHGLKGDGLDLSKTPHSDPILGTAYQFGYDVGVEKALDIEKTNLELLDFELACELTIHGETQRRAVSIRQLLKIIESQKSMILHTNEEKTLKPVPDNKFII